jgi:hypothetical protein
MSSCTAIQDRGTSPSNFSLISASTGYFFVSLPVFCEIATSDLRLSSSISTLILQTLLIYMDELSVPTKEDPIEMDVDSIIDMCRYKIIEAI